MAGKENLRGKDDEIRKLLSPSQETTTDDEPKRILRQRKNVDNFEQQDNDDKMEDDEEGNIIIIANFLIGFTKNIAGSFISFWIFQRFPGFIIMITK